MTILYTATSPRECTVTVQRADADEARFALAEEIDALAAFGWTAISAPTCQAVAGGHVAVVHMRREA